MQLASSKACVRPTYVACPLLPLAGRGVQPRGQLLAAQLKAGQAGGVRAWLRVSPPACGPAETRQQRAAGAPDSSGRPVQQAGAGSVASIQPCKQSGGETRLSLLQSCLIVPGAARAVRRAASNSALRTSESQQGAGRNVACARLWGHPGFLPFSRAVLCSCRAFRSSRQTNPSAKGLSLPRAFLCTASLPAFQQWTNRPERTRLYLHPALS